MPLVATYCGLTQTQYRALEPLAPAAAACIDHLCCHPRRQPIQHRLQRGVRDRDCLLHDPVASLVGRPACTAINPAPSPNASESFGPCFSCSSLVVAPTRELWLLAPRTRWGKKARMSFGTAVVLAKSAFLHTLLQRPVPCPSPRDHRSN